MTQVNSQTHPENQFYTPNSTVITVDFNKRSIIPEIHQSKQPEIEKSTQSTTQYKVAAPIQDDEYLVTSHEERTKVQPILKEDYHRLKEYFLNKPIRYTANALRDYTWFVFAYHTGRRASDFTRVRVCDIMNADGTIKDYWNIAREQKTGIKSTVPLNQFAKEALNKYFAYKTENNIPYSMSDYLFVNYAFKKTRCDATLKTRLKKASSDLTSLEDIAQHLTTENIRTILKKAAKEIDIAYNVGSHSPRKSIGAMAAKYSDDPNVEELICEMYGHKDKKTSRIYMEQNILHKKEFMEECGKYMEKM